MVVHGDLLKLASEETTILRVCDDCMVGEWPGCLCPHSVGAPNAPNVGTYLLSMMERKHKVCWSGDGGGSTGLRRKKRR